MHRTLLSRRTWLWTSTSALAAACARPAPTRVPAAGPEAARALTSRGAENLLALAELSAVLRWMHPSDQVIETQWEPLLLDGVRSLESASTRVELVEGLRGLLGSIAPTMLVWRSHDYEEDKAALDEPACPDPEAEATEQGQDEQPAASKSKASEAEQPAASKSKAKEAEAKAKEADDDEAKAKEPDEDEAKAKEPDAKAKEPDDDEAKAKEPDDDEADTDTDAGEAEDEDTPAKTDADEDEAAKPEPKPEPEPEPEPDPDEDRPPLHEALFAEGDALELVQWQRLGFADGLDGQPGCAMRVVRDPSSACAPDSACTGCVADGFESHVPGAPVSLTLPRGLIGSIPLALWQRDGRTLPAQPPLPPAPPFDQRRAWDYDLADRGTRLLTVLRCYALLRHFYPHTEQVAAPSELLRTALCAAADSDEPADLHAALERLLAGFGDGNGELLVELGKPARRFAPALSLAWVEERVVVVRVPSGSSARPGDVVTAIDGVAIDAVLASERALSPAATPSAAIQRTVERLLVRRERDAKVELVLLRSDDAGEQTLALQLRASEALHARPLADLRPRERITELADGVWYVDATRVTTRASLVRRLRRATTVIVDLRGCLADDRLARTLLAHSLDEPLTLGHVRELAGPDAEAELHLIDGEAVMLEPRRPRLRARLIALADARTRGAAELLLAGFDRRGLAIVGSNSAGDPGEVGHAWLPGGWQLRFTTNELRLADGGRLWARGVPATVFVEPSRASLVAGEDPLLAAALGRAS